jgi:hypothetical protein
VPVLGTYTATAAVLFDSKLSTFDLKVNGDMHIGTCVNNPLVYYQGKGNMLTATPAKTGMQKCLQQEVEGPYAGVQMKFEHAEEEGIDEVVLTLEGTGVLRRIGGSLIVVLTRGLCAQLYKPVDHASNPSRNRMSEL